MAAEVLYFLAISFSCRTRGISRGENEDAIHVAAEALGSELWLAPQLGANFHAIDSRPGFYTKPSIKSSIKLSIKSSIKPFSHDSCGFFQGRDFWPKLYTDPLYRSRGFFGASCKACSRGAADLGSRELMAVILSSARSISDVSGGKKKDLSLAGVKKCFVLRISDSSATTHLLVLPCA